jgi:MarR family transcriptional regulator, organic hydroperoxide resistance regulator
VDRDLGALLYALTRAVVAAEEPVLRAHDLEMWDYVVLSRLAGAAAPTQATLAAAVGRDKTRLIPLLDRLEARGLLRRTPDPDDRRNRIVALTPEGRALVVRCRDGIRAMEDELLAGLAPDDLTGLRRLLTRAADELDV